MSSAFLTSPCKAATLRAQNCTAVGANRVSSLPSRLYNNKNEENNGETLKHRDK